MEIPYTYEIEQLFSDNIYLKFIVEDIHNVEKIDVLFWGPFTTTIDRIIGEYVGVVRDGSYAIGFQSLNAKTTGGKKLNADGTDPGRGTVATKESYGPVYRVIVSIEIKKESIISGMIRFLMQ